MNNILPTLAISLSLIVPSPALTDDDLTPAALAGKTLTFTIEHGDGVLPASGTWSGKFETAPANGFTIRNAGGATINATRTYLGYVAGHAFTIDPFITGQPAATLTLWISEGTPNFYVDLAGATQYGDFIIGTPSAADIAIQQPIGSNLTDGKTTKSFGSVKVGSGGIVKTFTIKNTGNATLSGLAIRKDGANKGDFLISAPGKTKLAPGARTTFKVTFKPAAKGTRKAALHIASNDADENPFDIKLAGEGVK